MLIMEPPSSINIETGKSAGQKSDDLPKTLPVDPYLIVTRQEGNTSGEGLVVCAYSVLTGLAYLGISSSIES